MRNFIFIVSALILISLIPSALADDENTVCTQNCENLENNEKTPDLERPKYYKIIEPDFHIDFEHSEQYDNDFGWDGLTTSSKFWKIKDGEGYFFLHSKTKQLDSATFDILPRLDSGEEVGEDWILRYKLSLDNYEQSTTPTYSELLIGIFDSKNSAITNQWGIGTAFLNGANMKYTNLMYDFGTYNEWHCCPLKGELKNENLLPNKNKTWWIEYVKTDTTLTVRFFEDNDFKKLIEQKSVTGWEVDGLRYLKIIPLVEDGSVNGHMYGRIDDIKFYNHETTVYQVDKKPIPEELVPKTLDEVLKEVYGDDYVESEPESEEIFTTPIPDSLNETVLLWANGKISDDEFYSTIKNLVIQERMLVEELSRAYGAKLDLTYKPQTIKIPKDPKCMSCISEKFVDIVWVMPEGLPRQAAAVVEIVGPNDENIRLTTQSSEGITFRITSEFTPGLYEIFVKYGNEKFSIAPLLLTEQNIPKTPFWVKYNAAQWANGKLPEIELVDSLIYLIQNGKITFDYEIFIKKESEIIVTPQEKLEKFFPTEDELKDLGPTRPPPLWEYLSTNDAVSLVHMDYSSAQKILEDRTRTFDPLYNQYDVPFTMMQIYQFESDEIAQRFIEEQIWATNVLLKGNVNEDDITYDDYRYHRIFENADMSGTSEKTGDCLYYLTENAGGSVMDETHFVQCVLNEKIIQVYVYEDYPNVDKKFAFNLMDLILEKINNTSQIQSVKNILSLNNISNPSTPNPSTPNPSQQPKIDKTDPEISGSSVGINNFVCKKDDFGTVNMVGQYVNGQTSFEKISINISIESYDGVLLAYGNDYVMKVNPYETRNFEGYVFVDEPFHKCHATIDWNNSN